MTQPTPSSGGYNPYASASGSTAVGGVTDIFNLDQRTGDTMIPVAAYIKGSVHLPPGTLPHGMQRDAFQRANDFPVASTSPVTDTIRNIVADTASLAYRDPNKYQALQQQLFLGGFFGSTKSTGVAWGSWSGDTKAALVQALIETAQVAQSMIDKGLPPPTFAEVLADRVAKAKANQPIAPSVPAQYSDPAQVAQTAQAAAEAAIGRRLNDKELATFQAHFHSQEGTWNAQRQAASVATGPSSITQPDLGGEAEQFVNNNMTSEVGAQRGQDYIHALLAMVGVKGA